MVIKCVPENSSFDPFIVNQRENGSEFSLYVNIKHIELTELEVRYIRCIIAAHPTSVVWSHINHASSFGHCQLADIV